MIVKLPSEDSKDMVITIPLPMTFLELLILYTSKLIKLSQSVLPLKVILKQLLNSEILNGAAIRMNSATLTITEKMPKIQNSNPKILISPNSVKL